MTDLKEFTEFWKKEIAAPRTSIMWSNIDSGVRLFAVWQSVVASARKARRMMSGYLVPREDGEGGLIPVYDDTEPGLSELRAIIAKLARLRTEQLRVEADISEAVALAGSPLIDGPSKRFKELHRTFNGQTQHAQNRIGKISLQNPGRSLVELTSIPEVRKLDDEISATRKNFQKEIDVLEPKRLRIEEIVRRYPRIEQHLVDANSLVSKSLKRPVADTSAKEEVGAEY